MRRWVPAIGVTVVVLAAAATPSGAAPSARLTVSSAAAPDSARPSVAPSGSSFTLDARQSSDSLGGRLEYRFDTDRDGSFDDETFSTTGTAGPHAIADDTVTTFAVQVRNGLGETAAATATATTTNRPPRIGRITGPANVNEAPYDATLGLSSFSDPDDPATALRFAWDLDGDGVAETSSGTSSTLAHRFATESDLTLRAVAGDDDGATVAAARRIVLRDTTPPDGSFTVAGAPKESGKFWVAGATYGIVGRAADAVTPADELEYRVGASGPWTTAPSAYPVEVLVRDAAGNARSLGRTAGVDLDDTAPVVSRNDPGTAAAGGLVLVSGFDTATAIAAANRQPGGSGIAQVSVDWGDGTPASTTLPAGHAYAAPATYTRTISVSDAVGNVTRISDRIVVTSPHRAGAKPVGVVFDPAQGIDIRTPNNTAYQPVRAEVTLRALQSAGVNAVRVEAPVLRSAKGMAAYSTLVMPYIRALSVAERRQIVAYVRGGGGVVGIFYFGRDDRDHVPLVHPSRAGAARRMCRQPGAVPRCITLRGLRWGRESEWAQLSELMGGVPARPLRAPHLRPADFLIRPRARTVFLNDLVATEVATGLGTGPVADAVRRAAGGVSPRLTFRPVRGTIDPEMVSPGSSMRTFLRYTRITHARDCVRHPRRHCRTDRAKPGVPAAMARDFGRGRVIWFGFPFEEVLLGYEPSHTAENVAAATALLVGSADWTGRLR
jgi:hypothetical protein